MSAELILIKNGDDIANIGVSSGYFRDILLSSEESEISYDKIDIKISDARKSFVKSMLVHIMALRPLNIKEINEAIGESLDWYDERLIKAGRTQAIINCIDEYSDLEIVESI